MNDISNTTEIDIYQHFINGKYVSSESGKCYDKINPANAHVDAIFAVGNKADINTAVKAARAAQKAWWELKPGQRGKCLYELSQLISKQANRIAEQDMIDIGKPISDARFDVKRAIYYWEFYAGLADKIYGQVNPVGQSALSYNQRDPLGVVAAIAPWNFPSWHFSVKVAPALACGNAVIFKPSEHSPRSALLMAELCQKAGLPDGLVNVITGEAASGEALVKHPDVDHISFTGSSEVGKLVAGLAGARLASYNCQLSGKTPSIVFEDADYELALNHCINIICRNQGQNCMAGSRLLVQDSIRDKFTADLCKKIEAIKVGEPRKKSTQMGCIVSREQMDKIECFIRKGMQEGAKVISGGNIPEKLKEGYYFSPTVFDQVREEMSISNEDICGPVLCIMGFKKEEDALRMANNSQYGKAAWVFTNDIRRVNRMANSLDVGTVGINCAGVGHPAVAASGLKESGVGSESGMEAVSTYTRLKNVWINLDPEPPEILD